MAEKDDHKDNRKLAEEGIKKNGSDDNSNITESGEKEQENNGKISNTKKSPGSKKWILFSVVFLILLIMGTGFRLIPNLLSGKEEIPSFSAVADIKDDNLIEENLSPFFIPPSPDSSRGAIRIDLSAIWDGLASIRFQKNELQTRSRLYDYITERAEKNEDLNPIISLMEEDMSRIFQESLGVRGLSIRIKEIKYL